MQVPSFPMWLAGEPQALAKRKGEVAELVESAGLLTRWRSNPSLGSNPSLTANSDRGGMRLYRGAGNGRNLHRVLAERAFGGPLPEGVVVHHVDRDPLNAHPRLVICQDQRYHKLLHRREQVLAQGGDPDTQRWCPKCGLIPMNGVGSHRQCKVCFRKRKQWRRALRKPTPEQRSAINRAGAYKGWETRRSKTYA